MRAVDQLNETALNGLGPAEGTLPPPPRSPGFERDWVLRPDMTRVEAETDSLMSSLADAQSKLGDLTRQGLMSISPQELQRGLFIGAFGSPGVRAPVQPLIESCPAVVALIERVASFGVPDELAYKAVVRGGEGVRALLRECLIEEELRRQLFAVDHGSFEQAVRREIDRQGWRLDHMAGLVKDKDGDFNGRELFRDMALARGVVLKTQPIIIPDFATLFQTAPEPGWPWLFGDSFVVSQNISGFRYSFGFAEKRFRGETRNAERDDGMRSIWLPAIAMDRELFELLEQIAADPGAPEGAAAVRDCLGGVRLFSHLGGHDYVHQMIYGFAKRSVDRSYFCNEQAPITAPEIWLSKINDRFSNHVDTKGYYSGTKIETFSALMNLEVWERVYAAQPAVKSGVLRAAANFIGEVGKLSDLVERHHGRELADRIASYFAVVGLSQVELTMRLDAQNMATKEQESAFARLVESVERLRLPPYAPPVDEIQSRCSGLSWKPHDFAELVYRGRDGAPPDLSEEKLAAFGDIMRRFRAMPSQYPTRAELEGIAALVWASAPLVDMDGNGTWLSAQGRENMGVLSEVFASLPGAPLSDAARTVQSRLERAGLVRGGPGWSAAKTFVDGSTAEMLAAPSRRWDVIELFAQPGAKGELLAQALASADRHPARADIEPSLDLLARELSDGRRRSGWRGMKLRLELEGYRPPWIHRYRKTPNDMPQPQIARNFYASISESGLLAHPEFLKALEAYEAAPRG